MSKILFSPIGSTDPIRNMQDGSMLHICRKYMPDRVILYFSKEMLQYHLLDNRYVYCLEELGKKTGHSMEIKIIERPELEEVQDYEVFYEDFRGCVSEISRDMGEGDSLLVNISSGTPAMKSALVVLSAMGEFPFQAIQVSTPLKSSNYIDENQKTYQVKEQWECNMDNETGRENRSREIHSSNLMTLLKINYIEKYLGVYDYAAALMIAEDMGRGISPRSILLLKQAVARIHLNAVEVSRIAKETNFHPFPVRTEGQAETIEYMLSLQRKAKRCEYDDFIRGLTPIILDLMEKAYERQCHVKVEDFTSPDKNGVRKWDEKKLANTDLLKKLNQKYGKFQFGSVSSDHLRNLIVRDSPNQQMNTMAERLRDIEIAIRNPAAHTMVSITEERIKQWVDETPHGILEKILRFAEMAGVVSREEREDITCSYERMNREIMDEIRRGLPGNQNEKLRYFER